MKIELLFEERIFEYHAEFSPKGYTPEEFDKEKPVYLIVDVENTIPCIGDIFLWGDIEKPTNATSKQWDIIKEYSFKVTERQIGMDGYIGLGLDII